MWSRLRNLVKERLSGPPTYSVAADRSGVVISTSDGSPPRQFAWDDVDEVTTFKRDLATYDVICLSFNADGLWHEVWESDDGWEQLVERMHVVFPSIPPDWYAEVMLPAFAPSHRSLWQR